MSSSNFDFLADSFLLNDVCIDNHYKDFSENDIESEMEKYREFCLANINHLTNDAKNINSELKVVSRNNNIDQDRIIQSALYLDNYVVYDPLFELTKPIDEVQKTAIEFFGHTQVPLRQRLLNTITDVKILQPLVAGNYVRMLPMSYYFEPPEEVPVYISGLEYDRRELNYDIRKYFVDHARVKTYNNKRRLTVRYGDYDGESFEYYYFDASSSDQSSNRIYGAIEKDAQSPSDEDFREWMQWCFYSSSLSTYEEVSKHISIASTLQAQPIVSSQFESGLLCLNSPNEGKSITTATAEAIMNIDLPFLDRIDLDKLMEWRNHETVFNNFRNRLEQFFKQARFISDPIEVKRLQEDFIHEVTKVELPQLKKKLEQLSLKTDLNAMACLFSFAAAFQNNFALLGAVPAIYQGVSTILDYNAEKKANPYFFLHKVLRPE